MIITEQSNLFETHNKVLTCDTCLCRKECEFVDDPYNTNGDCLQLK
jgi:hypothetical protein